jgi:Restriction endonuclease
VQVLLLCCHRTQLRLMCGRCGHQAGFGPISTVHGRALPSWGAMTWHPFIDELERLKRIGNSQQRGYEFQTFVGSLFRQEHFKVIPNARAARPRQVDLVATRGPESYLIETKWLKRRANVDDVDSLFTRLDVTHPSVTGVMVSYSGFTTGVIARVRTRAKQPILLVTGDELAGVLDWSGALTRLLRQKKDRLLTHGEVLLGADGLTQPHHRPATRGRLPASPESVVFRDGQRSGWLSCKGDFGQFVFARELPDIDWVPGSGVGVTLDLSIPITREKDLIGLLHQLGDMGWATVKSRWSIQQATTNWHGSGANAFAEVLSDWKTRYAEIDTIHHTEEFCYFDVCEGGFYTLTGQVSADKSRRVRQSNLSFQLSGIPLKPDALSQLCDTFDASPPIYFRPRNEKSVERHHLSINERRILTVVAYVVEDNDWESDPNDREWAAGIVAKNPYYRKSRSKSLGAPEGWPSVVADSELIVCDLRSWHSMRNPKKTYRLWNWETAQTSDGVAFRPVADWDDDPSDDTTLITMKPFTNKRTRVTALRIASNRPPRPLHGPRSLSHISV